jgi:hypothetical protein
MEKKKGEAPSEFEVTSGVTLSRTLIPTLPPNYLSRKHLFPLLDQSSPSTTVLIAPAGYGKTSLVAEWAQSRKEQVIWTTLTESDSLEEMSAIFIQATRNILPGFALGLKKSLEFDQLKMYAVGEMNFLQREEISYLSSTIFDRTQQEMLISPSALLNNSLQIYN